MARGSLNQSVDTRAAQAVQERRLIEKRERERDRKERERERERDGDEENDIGPLFPLSLCALSTLSTCKIITLIRRVKQTVYSYSFVRPLYCPFRPGG